MTNHHSIHHHGGPTLPCGACRKRHVRSGGAAVPGSGGLVGLSTVNTRKSGTALISFAALAAAAIAIAPGQVHAAAVAASFPGGEGTGLFRQGGGVPGIRSAASHQAKLRRRLQLETEEDDHDHDEEEATALFDTSVALAAAEGHDEDEHEDHEDDHGDEVEEEHEDDHSDPNSDMAAFLDMDSHAPHAGYDEDEDEHSGHDHSNHDGDEDEDDHSGHDHSDHEEEFSSLSAANEKLPWGQVIGATLLVNLAALSGVLIILATAVHAKVLKLRGHDDVSNSGLVGHGLLFDICIPAFAVGALIATAVFLIFPEALHLIEGGHEEHSDHGEEADAQDDHSGHDHRILQEDSHDDSSESVNAAKFGCAILGGFLLPLVFSIIFHRKEDNEFDSNESKDEVNSAQSDDENCASCRGADEVETGLSVTVKTMADSTLRGSAKVEEGLASDNGEEEVPALNEETTPLAAKTIVDRHLCASILLGDAFHNFADGIFIGAAFKSCSTSVALSIIFVTLFHEIAQELADFILLTRYAGLSIVKAMVLNFISGLSVCLGGIVYLAADPSNEATGVVLAMAGGVYFNIAACETIPRLEAIVKSRGDRIWTLFSVIVGTIPIGLILLNHKHCG